MLKMNKQDFINEVEAEYKKLFPKSRIVTSNASLSSGGTIFFSCYLVGDRSEALNNIIENDMLKVCFMVHLYGYSTDNTTAPLSEIECNVTSKWIAVKPPNTHFAYGSHTVGVRKFKANPQNAVKKFAKYLERIKEDVTKLYNEGQIHEN